MRSAISNATENRTDFREALCSIWPPLTLTPQYGGSHNVYYVKSGAMLNMFMSILWLLTKKDPVPDKKQCISFNGLQDYLRRYRSKKNTVYSQKKTLPTRLDLIKGTVSRAAAEFPQGHVARRRRPSHLFCSAAYKPDIQTVQIDWIAIALPRNVFDESQQPFSGGLAENGLV